MPNVTLCAEAQLRYSHSFDIDFSVILGRYEQPSGYRPAPVDLSQVFLSPAHEEVVSLLAENDHNAWAKEKIKQGWTYGAQQVYIPHSGVLLKIRLQIFSKHAHCSLTDTQ